MKRIRKILIGLLVLLALPVLAIMIAPGFFKGKLIEAVKIEVNKYVQGGVNFGDVGLSWWKAFPDIALTLDDIVLGGIKSDSLQSDLFRADRLSLGFDFWSVWSQSDSLQINSFILEKPQMILFIDKEGQANYDILEPDTSAATEASSSKALRFALSDYKIEDASIRYQDQLSSTDVDIKGLQHRGDLEIEGDRVLWTGDLTTDQTTVTRSHVAWLNRAQLSWEGTIEANTTSGRYDLGNNELHINDLAMSLVGFLEQQGEDWTMDLSTETNHISFASILSLLPNMYSHDFKKIDAAGDVQMDVSVKGRYAADGSQYPVYHAALKITDARYQYPGLDLAMDDIHADISLNNQAHDLMPTIIDIADLSLLLDREKLFGRLKLEAETTGYKFDGALKGMMNLASLSAAYPMPDVTELSGLLDVDLSMKGSTQAIETSDFQALDYTGYIKGSDINLQMSGLPPTTLDRLDAHITPRTLELSQVIGEVGKSDFSGTASISPALPLGSQPLHISGQLSGRTLDLDEWLSDEKSDSDAVESPTTGDQDLLRKLQLNITAQYDQIHYGDYDLSQVQVDLRGHLQDLEINYATARIHDDQLTVQGRLRGIYDYIYADDILSGDLKVTAPTFHLDPWMSEDQTDVKDSPDGDSTQYVAVPDQINLTMNIDAGDLYYDQYHISKATGQLRIADQEIIINDVKGRTLGGQFWINGLYAYDGTGEPRFKMAYDIDRFGFEDIVEKSGMFSSILPIIQFLNGTFNSDMVFEGSLKNGYMPDLKTITGQGLIETLHAGIVNNPTLDRIANALQLNEIKRLTLDKSHNRFSIKQGIVTIEPFDQKIDDIHARISGDHQIFGNMDYRIALTIPTAKFQKLGIPSSIMNQVSGVQKQLNKLGVDIQNSESIQVNVLLSGSLSDPKVNVQLVDFSNVKASDIADALIQKAQDSVKTVAQDKTLQIIKQQTGDTTSTTIKEAVTKEVQEKLDSTVKPLKDTLVNEIKDKVNDEVEDAAKKALDKWNPFKKKN